MFTRSAQLFINKNSLKRYLKINEKLIQYQSISSVVWWELAWAVTAKVFVGSLEKKISFLEAFDRQFK